LDLVLAEGVEPFEFANVQSELAADVSAATQKASQLVAEGVPEEVAVKAAVSAVTQTNQALFRVTDTGELRVKSLLDNKWMWLAAAGLAALIVYKKKKVGVAHA